MPIPIRRFLSRFRVISFLIGLALCLGLQQPLGQSAPPPSPLQQVQQGVDRYQSGDYVAAIALWKTALAAYQQAGDRANAAIVLENLARAYQHLGQTTAELDTWNQLIRLQRPQNNPAQMARLLVEQAQALSRSGQVRKAIALLCHASHESPCNPESALKLAEMARDETIQIAALGSLGDAYRLVGEYQPAIAYLEAGLQRAQALNHRAYQVTTLQALGTVYNRRAQLNHLRAHAAERRGDSLAAEKLRQRQQADETKALQYFGQSLQLAQQMGNPAAQLRSLLTAIPLKASTSSVPIDDLQQAAQLLAQLPHSRERVYATIDLARLYSQDPQAELTRFRCVTTPSMLTPQVEALLRQAVSIARTIQDPRAESFALGELGHLYECQQQYATALSITHQAQLAAQLESDSRYLWEWQTGRILAAQGKTTDAISAYDQAIATLEPIRSDLLTNNRDLQLDFRDAIEPIYREAIALQLRADEENLVNAAETTPSSLKNLKSQPAKRPNLAAALKTVDSLRLAELQNYFGNDCVIATVAPTSDRGQQAMANSAVLNTIILGDRTVVVAQFPDGHQQRHTLAVDQATLQQEANLYRIELEKRYPPRYQPKRSQTLYDWLIRPFATDLKQSGVKTLVFVQDGIFRTIPMAALHDGQQFLVQQYAVVTTPSLGLTDLRPPNRQTWRSLAMGMSQEAVVDGKSFIPLANVPNELEAVRKSLPESQVLLNQDFTRDRLEQELRQTPFPILHMATHGQFGTDPADTFLLLGDQKKLTITELEDLIRRYARGREPIDLLTLTACQTAVGDDRAALGLAGVALQAGVKSALASLWSIDDVATAQFATTFYDIWRHTSGSKAEAVQKAQQALIASQQFNHPYYWAPFVLVGNWL
jgi:CHAT domain-containing protein